MQKPMLNLGCGHVILPREKPAHHALVDDGIYTYPLWHNVDRNGGEGVDECVDVFTYPWRWEDNSFDGALLSHLCEHIPHEIKVQRERELSATEAAISERLMEGLMPTMKRSDPLRMPVPRGGGMTPRAEQLSHMQDGWYAFFSELYRVLTPDAIVHILSPYGWSQGAITDPTHTRLLTEHSFTHSMQPDPNSPFTYETGGIHFEMVGYSFGVYPMFSHLLATSQDDERSAAHKRELFVDALQTRINVVNDLYVKLKVVK